MTLEEYNLEKDTLMHYGIIGMKWGYRRYQNGDGTLTPAGRKRYGIGQKLEKETDKLDSMKYKLEKYRIKGKDKKYAKQLEKIGKQTGKMEGIKSKYDSLENKVEYQSNKLNRYIAKKEAKAARHQGKIEAKELKEREKIVRKGDAQDILRNMDKLSPAEIDMAISRINKETLLKDLNMSNRSKSLASKTEVLDKTMKFAEKAAAMVGTYETVAKAVNTVTGKDTLTVFSERNKKAKEAEDKKNKVIDDIITSGDYDKIMSNRDKLSRSEFKEAISNLPGENISKYYAVLEKREKYLNNGKDDKTAKTASVSGSAKVDVSSKKLSPEIESSPTDSPKVEATKKELKAEAKAIDKKLKELAKADVTSYGFESKTDAALKMVKKYNNDLHDLESATGFHLAPITKATQDKITKDTTYAMKWMGDNKAYTNASYTSVADSVNKGGTYDFTSILREVGTVKANDIKIDSYLGGFDGSKSTERGYDKRYKMKF